MNTTINDDIKSGEYKRAYLLYGDEDYLKKNFKDRLLKALIPDGDSMNYSYYEGNGIDISDVIDVAETMPFFADYRVIHINDSGFFKKADDKLVSYLENPSESCVFIFTESEVDKRSKTYKAVDALGGICEMNSPDERQLITWIGGKLKGCGKTMDRNALSEFMNRTADSMNTMSSELEKLIGFVGDRANITLSDVNEIVTVRVETKVFDMINLMAAGDLKGVLKLYHDLIAAREPAMGILYLIVRQFRQILMIKDLYSLGDSYQDIAAKTKIKDFFVKKNLAVSKDMSTDTIKNLLRDALEYERAFKSGELDEQMTIELLMIKYVKS